jgi:hypothetical protein
VRVHRLYRLRYGFPEHFRQLWEEQHPEQPEQLELPLVTSSGNGVAVLTKLEQVPLLSYPHRNAESLVSAFIHNNFRFYEYRFH